MIFEGQEYPYEIVTREQYHIGRIHVVKDTLKIDGQLYPYTFTTSRDSVCVFPVCEEGIVIIEQYRHSLNQWVLEIPAGGIDEGESKEQAARRELVEETGYIAKDLIDMGYYFENQGTSRSCCQLYFANCIGKEEQRLEKTEFIRTKVVTKDEFMELVETNRFHLLIGLVAWYRAKEKQLL